MRKQITDRPSYLRAHRNFDDLQDLLGNLQGKLSEVSKDVDKEFLASYRVHMLSIQSEIKTLREDVDKGVQALKSDGNVAKLELEVNWFVEECTRLRLHYTTMENDFVQMQSRFKAMMEQKVYMNEQLKAILKRNRVLEAEIDHALKHNQKIKKTEEENEAAWEAANIDDLAIPDAAAEPDITADVDAEVEPELPPDNFYHEQLRRLSAKSPLSTTKFVPPGSRSAKGSKTGSKAGSRTGSRDSSRDGRSPSRSRVASPMSPQRPGALNATMGQTAASGLGATSPGAGGGNAVDEGEGEEELDDFQRNDVNNSPGPSGPSPFPRLQQSSSLPQLQPGRSQRNQSPSGKGAASQQSLSQSQRIPKQEVMPVGTARIKERQRSKQQRHNQEELNNFLKHKSPAEASLERAIADIFEEVRARKICAAKRGAIKRFPVHFMGGSVHEGSEDTNPDGSKMVRKRSGGAGTGTMNASSSAAISSGGRGMQQQQGGLMPGTALGRRLAGEVSVEAQGEWAEDGEGGGVSGGRQLAPGLGEEEADLLRQPLIKATGGISGLGVSQLSDNDKFSCVVKYLLDFDRFKEVVAKLQQLQ